MLFTTKKHIKPFNNISSKIINFAAIVLLIWKWGDNAGTEKWGDNAGTEKWGDNL